MERRFPPLTGCYALLTALAALFLVYSHLAFASHPSISSHDFSASEALAGIWTAACALRDRMHTTWFFFSVFTAVWVTSLLWMLLERRRRQLSFRLLEATWIGWVSLSVFSTAVLYGLGTNGILARHFPKVVSVSDVLAIGFMLTLPVIVRFHLDRQQSEAAAAARGEPTTPSTRHREFLGLNDEESAARLIEGFSKLDVLPPGPPAVPIFHPAPPSEHTKAIMDRLIESAELPVASPPPVTPPHVEAGASSPAALPVEEAAAAKGTDGFREHLSTLNGSWQRIGKIGQEIDQWFDQQRRLAIAHLEMHPGLRGPELPVNFSRDFPNEKLAAVDAEWEQIRRATIEISRWFGDVPASDRAK